MKSKDLSGLNIFDSEESVIKNAETIVNDDTNRDNPILEEFSDLLNNYKKLYRQAKRMVRIGDRQQNQLNKLNVELTQKHTLLYEVNKKLEKLSLQDGLTGLANRRYFDSFLDKEWRLALRRKSTISLILADIDFFKKFNDTYGHQVGDECLKSVAKAIQLAVKRVSDLAARYGGEEFAIVLPETNIKGARSIADNIHQNVKKLKITNDGSQICSKVTVSVGIACTTPEINTLPAKLIEESDHALYQAKNNGRNQTCLFSV